MTTKEEKLRKLQEFIKYQFKDSNLLKQALTTPQLGNERNIPHYDVLETLGDAVIKTILISKKIKDSKGEIDSEIITKTKQTIENNESLANIAEVYFNLEQYVFTAKNQDLKKKDKKILADVLEAICGALYLDSNTLKLIEEKIINKFYHNWESFIEDSKIFSKNELLEYLQKRFQKNIFIKLEYEKSGPENELIWIAKNPKFYINEDAIKLKNIPNSLKSNRVKSKQEAEKDIYFKILKYLEDGGE